MPAPYAFDPTCRNPDNLILDERHTITVRNSYDFNYLIPDYAPFFTRDFKVYTKTNLGVKQYFTEGVDYVFGFRFIQGTVSTGLPLYGSLQFINRQFSGDLWLEYRTLGGDWNLTATKIQKILAEWRHNPVLSTWEQVANLPYQFPPTSHNHNVEDLTTVKDLIAAIRQITGNDTTQLENIVTTIVTNKLRNISKADLGLNNVLNLGILPLNQGSNNTDNYYVTPRGVRDIIDNYIKPSLDDHIRARGNVHGLTPDELGVYTKAKVDELLANKLGKTEKAEDTKKVDGRTAEQYKLYVLEGTAQNTTKFNNLSYSEMMDDVIKRMNALIASSGNSDPNFLPAAVAKLTAKNALHFDNKTPEQYRDWLKDNLFGKTYDQWLADLKSSITLLGGKSKEEIIAEAKQNVNATQLGNKTLSALMQDVNDLVANAPNALKFGGKTYTQAKEDISEQVLDDASESFVSMGSGARQEVAERTGQNLSKVVKLGKETGKNNVAVSLDDTDLGNLYLARRPLGPSVNLNTLTADNGTGIYSLEASTNPITSLNYPVDKKGSLMVLPSANKGIQLYFPEDDNSIYKRYTTNANGDWSAWSNISGGSEFSNYLKLTGANTTTAGITLAPSNANGAWIIEQTSNGNLTFFRKAASNGEPTGNPTASVTIPTGVGNSKIVALTDNTVGLNGNQTVNGIKTFSQSITGAKDIVLNRNEASTRPEVIMNDTSVNVQNIPTNKTVGRVLFNAGEDGAKNVSSLSAVIHSDKTTSAILGTYNTSGASVTNLRVFSSGNTVIGNGNDDRINKLQVQGTITAAAPEAGANNNQLATTAWVRTLLGTAAGTTIKQAVLAELIDPATNKFKQSLMPPAKWQ